VVVNEVLLVPPAAEYLPELVGPDQERESLLQALRANLPLGLELQVEGPAARAPETALALRERGVVRVWVCDLSLDDGPALVFESAALAAGLEVRRCTTDARWHAWAKARAKNAFPGAPWAAALGLDRPQRVLELQQKARQLGPAAESWLAAVRGFARLGLHPLAEVYAGNDLVARGDEYLINLDP
jgi:hypothetical protein